MSRGRVLVLAGAALGTIAQRGSSGAVTEAALRPFAATYAAAQDICQGEGRRLPTLAELQTFRLVPGQDMNGSFEMTGQTWRDDGTGFEMLIEDHDPTGMIDGPIAGAVVQRDDCCAFASGAVTEKPHRHRGVGWLSTRSERVYAAGAKGDKGSDALGLLATVADAGPAWTAVVAIDAQPPWTAE